MGIKLFLYRTENLKAAIECLVRFIIFYFDSNHICPFYAVKMGFWTKTDLYSRNWNNGLLWHQYQNPGILLASIELYYHYVCIHLFHLRRLRIMLLKNWKAPSFDRLISPTFSNPVPEKEKKWTLVSLCMNTTASVMVVCFRVTLLISAHHKGQLLVLLCRGGTRRCPRRCSLQHSAPKRNKCSDVDALF